MTPKDHNKAIGIMHLIYGGFNALIMLIMVPFFFFMGSVIGRDPQAPPEVSTVFGLMSFLFIFLALIFGLPPLIAGYGLLKRKDWGRVAGIVSSCFAALSFPFGTALAVYSLWFLFGEGKAFYQSGGAGSVGGPQWRGTLNEGAPGYGWEAQRAPQSREQDYVPPQQPPDWRA